MSANKFELDSSPRQNKRQVCRRPGALAQVLFASFATSLACAHGPMFNFGPIEAPALAWADALAADMVESTDPLTRAQGLVYQALGQNNDAAKVPFDESLAKIVASATTDIPTLLLIYSHRCKVPHGQNFDAPVAFCARYPAWERFATIAAANPSTQCAGASMTASNRYVGLFVEHLIKEEIRGKQYLPENQSAEAFSNLHQIYRVKLAPWNKQAMDQAGCFDDYSHIYKHSLLVAMRKRQAPAALTTTLPVELANSISVEGLAAELASNFAIFMARSDQSNLVGCARPDRQTIAPNAKCQQPSSDGKLASAVCPDSRKIALMCSQLASSILANGKNSAVSLVAAFAIQRVYGPKTSELARIDALLALPDLDKIIGKPINPTQAQALSVLITAAVQNGDIASQGKALSWLEMQTRELPKVPQSPLN